MVQVALEFYIITFQRNEVGTWYVASIFELKVQRIKKSKLKKVGLGARARPGSATLETKQRNK